MKKANTYFAIACLWALAGNAQSEMIKDGVWLVQQGDTWESILQTILPKKASDHERLIRKAKDINSSAIGRNGDLIVGKQLRFPGAKAPEQLASTDNQAGKVLISVGNTYAVSQDGSKRSLRRGDKVYSGETVETGTTSRAQIRFSDRSLLSLRPKTKFVIEEYSFNGKQDGSERSIYRLVQGGFRTVSGLIGKVNRDNYSVRTPVATIGIRGTHYGLSFCGSNCDASGELRGLVGGVLEGGIVAENESGRFQLGVDEFFHIEDIESDIQLLEESLNDIFNDVSQRGSANDGFARQRQEERQEAREEFEGVVAEIAEEIIEEFGEELLEEFQDPRIVEDIIREVIEAEVLDDILPGNEAEGLRFGVAFNGKELNVQLIGNEPLVTVVDAFSAASSFESASLLDVDLTSSGLDTDGQLLVRLNNDGSPVFFVVSQTISNEDTSLSLTETVSISVDRFTENNLGVLVPVTPQDTGSSQTFSTYWGRWAPDVVFGADGVAVSSEEGNFDENARPVEMPNGLHYIVSDADAVIDELSEYNNVKQLIDSQSQLAGGELPVLTFSYAGQGTSPTDVNGNMGQLDYANLSLDLNTDSITDLNIGASFESGDSYQLTLQNNSPIAVGGVLQGDEIDLSGTCSGGNNCGNPINLDGTAGLALLMGDASVSSQEVVPSLGPALGAALSYSAITSDIDTDQIVGISGAALLTSGPSEGGEPCLGCDSITPP